MSETKYVAKSLYDFIDDEDREIIKGHVKSLYHRLKSQDMVKRMRKAMIGRKYYMKAVWMRDVETDEPMMIELIYPYDRNRITVIKEGNVDIDLNKLITYDPHTATNRTRSASK